MPKRTSVPVEELDPYDPNLTKSQKKAILKKAKTDPVYFFTKVIRPKPK